MSALTMAEDRVKPSIPYSLESPKLAHVLGLAHALTGHAKVVDQRGRCVINHAINTECSPPGNLLFHSSFLRLGVRPGRQHWAARCLTVSPCA